MTPKRLVSIIIPTHNRRDLLNRTLADVDALDVPKGVECEVIVVANACTDQTDSAVAEHAGRSRLRTKCVSVPEPGLNPARNVGLEHARGEFLLFLDDDVRLDRALLNAMIEAYDEHGADLVGGRVSLLWEAVERPPWLPDDLLWVLSNAELGDELEHSPNGRGLVGACFGFHRRVAESIGQFRAGLDRAGSRLLGGGESDFIQRAIRAGFQAYHVPDMRAQHWVAPHRSTPAYILGVCRGYGETRIYLKPAFGFAAALRSLFGHTWIMVSEWLALQFATDETARMRHQARAALGLGGVRGCIRRSLRFVATS